MIDGLTFLLLPASPLSPARALRLLNEAAVGSGAKLDTTRIPSDVNTAMEFGHARAARPGFFGRIIPSLIDRAFEPAARHLVSAGAQRAAMNEAPLEFAEAARSLRLPLIQIGGLKSAYMLHTHLQPWARRCLVELVVDWRSLHKDSAGLDRCMRLGAAILRGLGAGVGAGGDAAFWAAALGSKRPLEDLVAHGREMRLPCILGAMNAVSAGAGGYLRLATVEGVVGLVASSDDDRTGKATSEPSELPERPFTAVWAACSGRFVGTDGGHNNATAHFVKHVQQQAEWGLAEMPQVEDYVRRATTHADRLDVYEFRQPANGTIIKYDPSDRALAIVGRSDGHLRTFFRPCGDTYVLRKLEHGRWQPPPIEDIVAWDTPPSRDPHVGGLAETVLSMVDEAEADTTACLVEVCGTGGSTRLLVAIAWQGQLDFRLWEMRRRYIAEADEAIVDALDEPVADLRAKLEVALNKLQPDAASAIAEACRSAAASYLAGVAEGFADEERVEDLLFLRDQIGFAQTALRARSWITSLFDCGSLESVWRLLLIGDVVLERSNPMASVASSGTTTWPETFVWRHRRAK